MQHWFTVVVQCYPDTMENNKIVVSSKKKTGQTTSSHWKPGKTWRNRASKKYNYPNKPTNTSIKTTINNSWSKSSIQINENISYKNNKLKHTNLMTTSKPRKTQRNISLSNTS